jgi:epoxyqueuosine reductase QueG
MLKKSRGLESRFIDQTKFRIDLVKGDLAKEMPKIIAKMFKGMKLVKKIYKEELKTPPGDLKEASKEFWDEVIEKAKSLGIDIIGFAPTDENLIFTQDHTTQIESLYENAIVLGMEMDFEKINSAPEPPAGYEALRIYAELGMATVELTNFIRSKGYRAIGCHPLGGPILFPAMAVKANLGEIGSQGLLITKEFGPRQRLSLISINAGPLPESSFKKLEIKEFCDKCKKCILACPVNAIHEEPIENTDGTKTRIDGTKCFPYFYETVGCSICIKSCPFHSVGFAAKYYSRL